MSSVLHIYFDGAASPRGLLSLLNSIFAIPSTPPPIDQGIYSQLIMNIAPSTSCRGECPICMGSMGCEEVDILAVEEAAAKVIESFLAEPSRILPCGHAYHASCIDRWLEPKVDSDAFQCPTCRKSVN